MKGHSNKSSAGEDPRVLVVGINYAPEPTGIAPYTTGLSRGLADLGFGVNVLAAHPHYPAWRIADGFGGWVRDSIEHGVHLRRVRHYVPSRPSPMRRLVSEVTFGLRIATQRWGRPDVAVMVSPALFSTAIALVRARFAGVPTVVWIQDFYSIGIAETGQGGAIGARVSRAVESWVIRGATRVVVIHERFKAQAVSLFGIDPDRIEVVRNWTHVSPSGITDRARARDRLGWPSDAFVVLHAGNIGAKQALENVVDSARVARETGKPVRFVIMGDGSAASTVKARAVGLDNVHFMGPLPDNEFHAALGAADALLVNEKPGVREMAVPSKLTTYFSTGLPVIAATDETSITAAEIEASGGGLRVAAGDPWQLVHGVETLRAQPELAAELGKRGLRFRNAMLTESAAIARYASILNSLASTHERPRGRVHGGATESGVGVP